jgi:hypothetical protein
VYNFPQSTGPQREREREREQPTTEMKREAVASCKREVKSELLLYYYYN